MHHPDHADHTRHDVTLIAGHAAGDLIDSERIHAETLLATCSPCAELHHDLLAIAAATRTLPAPATATRDFRLDPEQAARLRRGSWLRAALRPFGAARSTTRPMAAAFTSLGIAGLLVATVMPALLGSPAALSTARDNNGAPAVPAAGPVSPLTGQPGAAGAPTPNLGEYNAGNQGSPEPDQASPGTKNGAAQSGPPEVAGVVGTDSVLGATQGASERTSTSPPNLLLIGSLVLLAVGVLLFGLRLVARRLR